MPKYPVKFAIVRLLWLILANFLVALSQTGPVCAVIATFSQNKHVRNNKNCENYQFKAVEIFKAIFLFFQTQNDHGNFQGYFFFCLPNSKWPWKFPTPFFYKHKMAMGIFQRHYPNFSSQTNGKMETQLDQFSVFFLMKARNKQTLLIIRISSMQFKRHVLITKTKIRIF